MKFRFVIFTAIFIFTIMTEPGIGCPSCFGASDRQVLHTYYKSAILLSLMPLTMIGVIGGLLLYLKRKAKTGKPVNKDNN